MMITLHGMVETMYRLSVVDKAGQQYLPLFSYDWTKVEAYDRAEDAIRANTANWINDFGIKGMNSQTCYVSAPVPEDHCHFMNGTGAHAP